MAHSGIIYENQPSDRKLKAAVVWKKHYFPLFNSPEYLNAAEGCRKSCKVSLKNKDELISHLFIRHSVLNLCNKCEMIFPCAIMKFHKKANCDEVEAIRLMDEADKVEAAKAKVKN